MDNTRLDANGTDLKGFPVPLPSVDEQKAALQELREATPFLDTMLAAADDAVAAAKTLPGALLREVFQPEAPYDVIDEEPDTLGQAAHGRTSPEWVCEIFLHDGDVARLAEERNGGRIDIC